MVEYNQDMPLDESEMAQETILIGKVDPWVI